MSALKDLALTLAHGAAVGLTPRASTLDPMRHHAAATAACEAVMKRLEWHRDEQIADREHDLSPEEETLVADELDDFISRASDVAQLALSAYQQALHPPPTGKCSVCGWVLIDAVDMASGKCIHHRIADELAARDAERNGR